MQEGRSDAIRTSPDIHLGGHYGWTIETAFRDVKEVVGAGRQQVRFVWANVGAFQICLWTFTMTEAWAWTRSAAELVDRSESPWDDPLRRPQPHRQTPRLVPRPAP